MNKKENLDCLFLVAGSSSQTYQKLSKTYSAIEPPTWALLLAQSTRSIGFKVNILDANAENLNHEIRLRIDNPTQPLVINPSSTPSIYFLPSACFGFHNIITNKLTILDPDV